MSIGYACLTLGVPDTRIKSCILKNASEDRLKELIYHNLISLENIIDYNIKNGILLFRISSDIIPFGSSSINTLDWRFIFRDMLSFIGRKVISSGMRVSMHPGQYTVLNSPEPSVVERAIADLAYHAQFLDSLGVGPEHKLILHIGGLYGNKQESADRFVHNYSALDEYIKNRLVIENDDRLYNIYDTLNIAYKLGIPAVFDNLHNRVNPYRGEYKHSDHTVTVKIPELEAHEDEIFWISQCRETWREKDGRQKIHYSQQDPLKKPGSHSETINMQEFMDFYNRLENKDIDIMLEVKDKNISAVKCIKQLEPLYFNEK